MSSKSVAREPHFLERVEERFSQIVGKAALKLDSGGSIGLLASQIYDAQRYEMEPLFREWIIAHITRLLRAQAPRTEPRQLALPGFELLPLNLRSAKGGHLRLRRATIVDLRAYRVRLFPDSNRLAQIDKLIALLKPLARGAMVEDALKVR